MRHPKQTSSRAFTLVELLVVTGIIAILLAILMPTLGKARNTARQLRAAAGVRELVIGYTQYSQDNKGALLWGYTGATVNGTPVTVYDAFTDTTFGLPIADRWPWRLAPYVKHVWKIIHIHRDAPEVPQMGDPHGTASTLGTVENKAYVLSLTPAFGINSVYLGGHSGGLFDGFVGDRPNVNKHVAFRQSEIRRPSSQIVFTEVQVGTIGMPLPVDGEGAHYALPPRANGQRWTVTDHQFVLTTGVYGGLPKGRYGKNTIAGFFDGHVETLSPDQLTDMRLWAPRATGPDWDF